MHPAPTEIKLHKKSQVLELCYGTERFSLSAEFLRVHSPSAEVKGHGPGQEVLQHGKLHVQIANIEAQGNYAIKLIFDDGHDSGIYTWQYLYELGTTMKEKWALYCQQLTEAGKTRDPNTSVVKLIDPS